MNPGDTKGTGGDTDTMSPVQVTSQSQRLLACIRIANYRVAKSNPTIIAKCKLSRAPIARFGAFDHHRDGIYGIMSYPDNPGRCTHMRNGPILPQ